MADNSIAGKWIGKIKGTNNADVFFEVYEDGSEFICSARINDPIYGVAIYKGKVHISGNIVNASLSPEGDKSRINYSTVYANGLPIQVQIQGTAYGEATIEGEFTTENEIHGKWTSAIGTGGTFIITREDSEHYNGGFNLDSGDTIFIIMPISDADPDIEDCLSTIKRAASAAGVNAIRVDELEHSGEITDVILEKIVNSELIICDISINRSNVYYELGYAHALKKPVIISAKKDTIIPFDIKDFNIIIYKSYTDLEKRLIKRIESYL